MQQKKLLNLRDDYQEEVAILKISQMLVDFVRGLLHAKAIRSEQGPSEGWDDIVIDEANGTTTYLQVKRQYTELDRKKHVNPCFVAIREWVESKEFETGATKRAYKIVVPDDTQVGLAKEYGLHDLYDLCLHIKAHTDPNLASTLRSTAKFGKLFDWLISECGYKNDEQVYKVLRLVDIESMQNEGTIKGNTLLVLGTCFHSPAAVRGKIIHVLRDLPSFINCVKPRVLLREVIEYLIPDIARWTHYAFQSPTWLKSGIHDLEEGHIERPTVSVKSLWNPLTRNLLLINAPFSSAGKKLSKAILRLALHFDRDTFGEFTERKGWEAKALEAIGNTLGEEIKPSSGVLLNIRDMVRDIDVSDAISLDAISGTKEEATTLHAEMSEMVAKLVKLAVNELILDMHEDNPIQEKVLKRWGYWKSNIIDVSTERNTLFEEMLCPSAESDQISAVLRVGPKTVHLLAQGLFMLLIVSIAMGGSDTSCRYATDEVEMKVLAGKSWSGAEKSNRARPIHQGEAVVPLCEGEKAKILLLSGTDASPNQVLRNTFASKDVVDVRFAGYHKSAVVLTNDPMFQESVALGDMKTIANEIWARLNAVNQLLKKEIKATNGN